MHGEHVDVRDRLEPALAHRYRLDEVVGRGGMATVFRASDLRHRRDVAIKVLRPDLGLALGPDRFLREIEIAAGLRHPHILPLYDSGDAAGLLYYVMPYVTGRSLRERLDGHSTLPVAEAMRVTRDIAEALAYAHARGVIHRDIKPGNILLEADYAVLADFGIAVAVLNAAAERLTDPGAYLGTPEYMSPELIFGDEPVDHRSDVYSLACVVYEMLTGQPPFTGANARAVLARQAHEPPPSLAVVRPDVPASVAEAVARALAKYPADRYASALDFAEAMRTEPAVPPEGPSVAVLPFTDLGAGGENAFLGEGIAEEIITALAKLGGVRVAPRSASFSVRARRSDVAHAGRELRVRTVLDGSVRRVGSRLRVTVQLIDTADGSLRWSERYDRELTDVFALQDEIARQVAGAFAVVVAGRGQAPPPKDVAAVEFYMRGRQLFREFRRRPMEQARQMFLRSIDADPGYARAYAGLADTDCFLHMYFIPTVELLAEAEEASRRALELAPGSAESRASRGLACALRKDFEAADREFAEAVLLDPRLFEAHYFWGRADFQRGHLDDALRHFTDACALREDYQAYLLLAQAIEAAGRRDEAREAYARALKVTEHHVALNPDDGRALTMGSVARARLNLKDGALRWVEQAVAAEPEDPVILYSASGTYAVLGMVEESLALFSRAIRLGFANRQWIEEDPDFDGVRDDPRFRAVIDDLRQRSGARAAVKRPPTS